MSSDDEKEILVSENDRLSFTMRPPNKHLIEKDDINKALDELVAVINWTIMRLHDEMSIQRLSSDQEYTFCKNKSLQSKLRQYVQLLLLNDGLLETSKHPFALQLFSELLLNIDGYIRRLLKSLFTESSQPALYKQLYDKIVICKIIQILFDYKWTIQPFEEYDETVIVSLFYSNQLISAQSKFKSFLFSYFQQKQVIEYSLGALSKYFQV